MLKCTLFSPMLSSPSVVCDFMHFPWFSIFFFLLLSLHHAWFLYHPRLFQNLVFHTQCCHFPIDMHSSFFLLDFMVFFFFGFLDFEYMDKIHSFRINGTLQPFVSFSSRSSKGRGMWMNSCIITWALVILYISIFLKTFMHCQFWIMYLFSFNSHCFACDLSYTWDSIFIIIACELILFHMKPIYFILGT